MYAVLIPQEFFIISKYIRKEKRRHIPPDIESIIANEIETIRSGRSAPLKVRKQSPVHFIYQ